MWPPKGVVVDKVANGKPGLKNKPKAVAKGKDKDKNNEKGGAQANDPAAVDAGGTGEYTWVPKNTFAEVDGDVEDQE